MCVCVGLGVEATSRCILHQHSMSNVIFWNPKLLSIESIIFRLFAHSLGGFVLFFFGRPFCSSLPRCLVHLSNVLLVLRWAVTLCFAVSQFWANNIAAAAHAEHAQAVQLKSDYIVVNRNVFVTMKWSGEWPNCSRRQTIQIFHLIYNRYTYSPRFSSSGARCSNQLKLK